MSDTEIRKKIRRLCDESKMGQREIAEKADITPAALNRYLQGTDMKSANLESLLNVFSLTLKAGKLRRK